MPLRPLFLYAPYAYYAPVKSSPVTIEVHDRLILFPHYLTDFGHYSGYYTSYCSNYTDQWLMNPHYLSVSLRDPVRMDPLLWMLS